MQVGGSVREFSVVTPEGVPLPFTVATAGDRIQAFGIDLVILFAGSLAVWIVCLSAVIGGARELGLAVGVLVTFALRNVYFIACEARWGGRTIGKRVAGLRVIAKDGGPLAVEAVLARNLTRELEVFLPLSVLLLGRSLAPDLPGWGLLLATLWLFVFALAPLANRERLRCGDIVGGTLVVRAPAAVLLPDLAPASSGGFAASLPSSPGRVASAPPRAGLGPLAEVAGAGTAAWGPAPRGAAAPPASEADLVFTRAQLDIYGIHELQVLEEVLQREAAGAIAPHLVEAVGDKIKAKIGWPVEPRPVSTVVFLRAFYRAQRARLEQKLLFGERQERKRDPGAGRS